MRIGLVFGAGGVIGGSWTIGALDALEGSTGLQAAQAELVIGTSAGAVVGAMAADGVSGAEMAARVTEDAEGEEDSLRAGALQLDWGLPSFGPGSWRLAASTLLAPQRFTAAALMAAWLPRGMVSTEPIRRLVASVVAGPWPSATGFRAVAADYGSAARVAFGAPGAPEATVGEAVAASCAIPGFYRPVRIDGRSYVDGGVWSASNVDLLAGAGVDLAICLNPLTSLAQATGGSPSDRIAAVMRASAARHLEAEARALREAGTEVVILQPEAPDVALMGFNMMSGARRLEVMAQARRTVSAQLEALRAQGVRLPGRRRRSAA